MMKKIVKIEAHDHFTEPRIQYDYDPDGTMLMTVVGELYDDNDLYYVVRTQYFTDEDGDSGSQTFHRVMKSAVISITYYTKEEDSE